MLGINALLTTTANSFIHNVTEPSAMPVRSRILSVDDVAMNRELISCFLQSDAWVVDQAESGEEALLAVWARRYDLILMDLRLPGLDGFEVARCIRRTEGRGRRTPIVALTADVLPQTLAAGRAAGLDGHIAKPFTSRSLRAEVARWLGGPPEHETLTPVLSELSERFGRTIVSGLLGELVHQLSMLEQTQPSDAPALSSRAHAIRGAAGTLGFHEVAQHCADLEAMLKRGQPAQAALARTAQACAAARARITAEIRAAA